MTVVAAVLAAAAVCAAGGMTPSPLPRISGRPAASARRGYSQTVTRVAVGVGGALTVVVLVTSGSASLDLLGLGGVTALVAAMVRRHRTEAARRRRHEAVIGLCGVLAAELQAGLPTQTALARACGEWPEFSSVGRQVRLGADVPSVLRALADRPGAEGLRAIAAGWTVAAHSGSSLARVLDRLAEGLRDESAARAEIEAALEPPRVTARMLAVLPAFGVALGTAIGADPVSFLLRTAPGRLCLLGGLLLALAGIAWVERLAASASRT
jgi:tight adherence protein B